MAPGEKIIDQRPRDVVIDSMVAPSSDLAN